MRTLARKALGLLRRGKRSLVLRLRRKSDLSVTAEHWGDEAREKAEGDDWQGLYWQSYVLTERNINRSIAGEPDENWLAFTKRRFFRRSRGTGLSLGCGFGILEREALRLKICDRFDAFDISPEAVEVARREADKAGYGDRIAYESRNLNEIELERNRYDAVFAIQSLHHIEALEHLLDEIRLSLRPDGLFVVNEYVGPVRFQFPDDHLPLMNGLLSALPESHLRDRRNGGLKTEIVRSSAEEVSRVDPSESVRSDEIIGLIEERFEIVYRADFGGTLLQHVLSNIVGNFDPADPRDVALVDLLCLYEETLIDRAVLPSDFTYLVAKAS
jgi:SAM-dependent methyltransferase